MTVWARSTCFLLDAEAGKLVIFTHTLSVRRPLADAYIPTKNYYEFTTVLERFRRFTVLLNFEIRAQLSWNVVSTWTRTGTGLPSFSAGSNRQSRTASMDFAVRPNGAPFNT